MVDSDGGRLLSATCPRLPRSSNIRWAYYIRTGITVSVAGGGGAMGSDGFVGYALLTILHSFSLLHTLCLCWDHSPWPPHLTPMPCVGPALPCPPAPYCSLSPLPSPSFVPPAHALPLLFPSQTFVTFDLIFLVLSLALHLLNQNSPLPHPSTPTCCPAPPPCTLSPSCPMPPPPLSGSCGTRGDIACSDNDICWFIVIWTLWPSRQHRARAPTAFNISS